MTLEEIKAEITEDGKNPDDFDIVITEGSYSISPKWFYEQKQIAKQEDEPIKEDVDLVAETIDYTLQDVESVAEIVVLNAEDLAVTADTVNTLVEMIAMQNERIEALENQINGGNA